jgi:hypothetical protein
MELSSEEIQQTAKVFTIQKKSITITAGVKKRVTYRELFNKFNILLPVSKFLLSLLSFIVNNMDRFQTNSNIYSINIRHKHDLHMPYANLTSYQKGAYYAGNKLFSTLPSNIRSLNHDIKAFKPALKYYLISLLVLCRRIYVK